jgi:cell division protein FtsX
MRISDLAVLMFLGTWLVMDNAASRLVLHSDRTAPLWLDVLWCAVGVALAGYAAVRAWPRRA